MRAGFGLVTQLSVLWFFRRREGNNSFIYKVHEDEMTQRIRTARWVADVFIKET